MPQTTPDLARAMRDADTRAMIHEISAAVSSVQENVRTIDLRLDRDSRRLDDLARDNREILGRLKEVGAKADKVLAFAEHGVPHLATKADLGELRTEISHRPTRRQAVEDLLKVGSLVTIILALLSFFSRAR